MVKIKKKGVYNNVILQNERKQENIHFSIYIYSLCRLASRALIMRSDQRYITPRCIIPRYIEP